jgi:hypothetical protein
MCTTLTAVGLIVAAVLLPLTPAGAAEITARDSDVTVLGRIERGDDERFTEIVTGKITTVYLASSGGDLIASLKIARLVKAWGLNTVVAYYAQCSSGCAIVWFAGKERTMMGDSRIGLHAARDKGTVTRSESGTKRMIEFMRILGAPEAVLALIEATDPTGMHWIDRTEARAMGLIPSHPLVPDPQIPGFEE